MTGGEVAEHCIGAFPDVTSVSQSDPELMPSNLTSNPSGVKKVDELSTTHSMIPELGGPQPDSCYCLLAEDTYKESDMELLCLPTVQCSLGKYTKILPREVIVTDVILSPFDETWDMSFDGS